MSLAYRMFINRDLPMTERACSSKAGFISRGEARHAARHGHQGDGSLSPYHCRYCGLWHLGHPRRH